MVMNKWFTFKFKIINLIRLIFDANDKIFSRLVLVEKSAKGGEENVIKV